MSNESYLPEGVELATLLDELRKVSWAAADVLMAYARGQEPPYGFPKSLTVEEGGDGPVSAADMAVNELLISGLKDNLSYKDWDILSEETSKEKTFQGSHYKKDWCWILDPLDGTKDFIQGTGNYAMHLALNFKKIPYLGVVLIPEKNELWISDGKKVWCEKNDGSLQKIHMVSKNKLELMTLVSSKNHRNKALDSLIEKIHFKKVINMGSIGCKIASILRGESDIYISISMPGQTCPKDWDFAAPEAILRGAGGAITNLNNQDLTYNKNKFEQGGIIVASNNAQTHESKCARIKEIIMEFDLFPINF